ncbi:MAG: beta-L-arabinofuranosidase domain-containing protein [Fimbriimonas sp.]
MVSVLPLSATPTPKGWMALDGTSVLREAHADIYGGTNSNGSDMVRPAIMAAGRMSSSHLTRRAFVGASVALSASVATQGFAQTFPSKGLRAPAYHPLPLGSVKARGWLLRQLENQRDGLTGHAEEVLPATGEDNAWKGGKGEDWEKGPYYLKGLVPLAYTLDDETLKKRAQAWIEPILLSQREDGFFGPKTNDDWWPRMVVTYLLRDYHEATGDARVVPFLTRYYRHMEGALPRRPLDGWGRARAGDEIDTVLWLYGRTGDAFLLSLADLLARQAYPWTRIFTENTFLEVDDFHPTHNVNVPQALKMPVVYSRRSGRREDREAFRRGFAHLMRDHGTPMGINAGSERLCGRSTVAGVETCTIVEYMLSAETALQVLGEARIGDELEIAAFNGLPAALSKDFRQHVYYSLPNNVAAVKGEVGFTDDHGDDRVVAPRSGFPCCCYNLHMGWPKLAQNAWATPERGGLALLAYVPSEVTAQLKDGPKVTVVCETDYPFEETIRLEVRPETEAEFPLHLRIPHWCKEPSIRVNGRAYRPRAGTFAVLKRRWRAGDRVELRFPMTIETLPEVNGAISVRRGPLTYALGLKEDWKAIEETKPGFPSYEVTTTSPWNYALIEGSLEAVVFPRGEDLFADPPVAIQARGKRVEGWGLRFDGRLSQEPPVSPVASSAPEEALTLVPFGSQMLRVSIFPVVGAPEAPPRVWREEFGPGFETRWLVFEGATVRGRRVSLPRGAKAIATETAFEDVAYESEVAVGKQGNAGLIFRVTEPSVGVDHYRGYYIGLDAAGGQVMLGKAENRWVPLAAQTFAVVAGQRHRVRVEARGPVIQVWVDDLPVLTFEDATYRQGAVGVRSYSDRASFGGLSARALG